MELNHYLLKGRSSFEKLYTSENDMGLCDLRENLFQSEFIHDTMLFFETFKTKYELFEWMKSRNKGDSRIVEINEKEDDIVIIPTKDVNGKWAKQALKIFNGFHIIFVESGESKYFNLSHSFNIGFKRALEYSPHWIIFSNDDMVLKDNPSVLKDSLQKADNTAPALFCNPLIDGHSYQIELGYESMLGKIRSFSQGRKLIYRELLERKFEAKIKMRNYVRARGYHYFDPVMLVLLTGDFGILNYSLVNSLKGNVFDETYIHGVEDIDLSIQLSILETPPDRIYYSIGSVGGGTRGKNMARWLKDVANFSYLNHKLTSISRVNFR